MDCLSVMLVDLCDSTSCSSSQTGGGEDLGSALEPKSSRLSASSSSSSEDSDDESSSSGSGSSTSSSSDSEPGRG